MDHARYLPTLRAEIDDALATVITSVEPHTLYGAVRHALSGKGKRLRPALLVLAAETFGVDRAASMPGALAVEIFHAFTLVHDDIMDDSDTRRGMPAVHAEWGQNAAILAGDFLLGAAYAQLGRLNPDRLPQILDTFNRMVVLLCEGQALDAQFESTPTVSVSDYFHMIDMKTAALIEASLQIGGILGAARKTEITALGEFGRNLGRAFQLQDDVLDLTASDRGWGKPIGGDLVAGKKTYILLKALEIDDADQRSFFESIVSHGGLDRSRVPEAVERLDQTGVIEDARNRLDSYYASAFHALSKLPQCMQTEILVDLTRRMQSRVH